MVAGLTAARIEAVIFDWGGTLTPWRAINHRASWRAYADAVHPDDPQAAAGATEALLAADTALWARARIEHRAFRIADVLEHAEVPWHDGAIGAYRAFWEAYTFTDPDVAPLMRDLAGLGLRLGVLSSTAWPAEWHQEILRRDGVLDLFHGTVWSSSLDWTKPHEQAFRAAMAAVGATDPARCVYVGDRLYDDVYGAAALGMRTILVPHSDLPADQVVPVEARPDAIIDRLADVAAVVARWRTQARA